MHSVYIAADEPLDERRKRTINRLFRNARRDRKDAEMADDGAKLFVDGVHMYTLKDGFVQPRAMQVLNVQLLQAVIMEQTNSHYFKLISYNCRGFNSYKSSYTTSLLSKCNLLLLQEHWLSHSQLSVLGNIVLWCFRFL